MWLEVNLGLLPNLCQTKSPLVDLPPEPSILHSQKYTVKTVYFYIRRPFRRVTTRPLFKKIYVKKSFTDESVEEQEEKSDNEEEDPIQKYKLLLEDIEKKEQKKGNKDMEMEITWGLGAKDRAEELVKKKINEGN